MLETVVLKDQKRELSMDTDRRRSLAVLTSMSAERTQHGRYRLTQKFVEGMQAYAKAWDGPVYAFFDPSSVDTGNLDTVEISAEDAGFQIRVLPFGTREFYSELAGRGVVLGMHSHILPDLATRCRALSVPLVYNAEYTLRTRLQFVRAERRNPLRQVWGSLWELKQEALAVRQFKLAAGLQCNGLPCYTRYAPLNESPLVYFDSRIRQHDLATEAQILESNNRRRRGQPLHLVFSGRLIRAKGADHLLDVARSLKARGVAFKMTICGGGVLEPLLARRIKSSGLAAEVQLAGVLDFGSELLPMLKSSADLFVCCHRQGDPSCTYLETFACGVPIVGYANEALSTFVNEMQAGATVPLNRAEALAELIARLDQERDQLCIWAYRARDFAAQHTMERTFEARIKHLSDICDKSYIREQPASSMRWEPAPASTTLTRARQA
jgi:glycosyltransferase involved in cell wall biosynthesis